MALEHTLLQELLLPDGGKHKVDSLESAYLFCTKIATKHYENFPVGSLLVGRERQPHFFAVYAFSRLADDIADELPQSSKERLENLQILRNYLYQKSESHPIFRALHNTAAELEIPVELFGRLITAFERDSKFEQPKTWEDIYDYCSYSANPIGEAVLYIFREHNKETVNASDAICTALQLTNFWQDFSRDIPNGRIYLPLELTNTLKLNIECFATQDYSANFRLVFAQALSLSIEKTNALFQIGSAIIRNTKSKRLRLELCLTIEGGLKILQRTKQLSHHVLDERPALTSLDWIMIIGASIKRFISSTL
jgi:hydroxysqualene synthase